MKMDKVSRGRVRKGRPVEIDDIFVAQHFARRIDEDAKTSWIAEQGIIVMSVCETTPDGTPRKIDRRTNGVTLARRYRQIAAELRSLQASIGQVVAAGGKTTWGAPIRFPDGVLPRKQPKPGRPRTKLRKKTSA